MQSLHRPDVGMHHLHGRDATGVAGGHSMQILHRLPRCWLRRPAEIREVQNQPIGTAVGAGPVRWRCPVTTRDALQQAMASDSVDDAMGVLIEQEVWLADVDTMTQAIHSVYCGLMADHEQPNEKDREQAKQLIAAIGQSLGTEAAATG